LENKRWQDRLPSFLKRKERRAVRGDVIAGDVGEGARGVEWVGRRGGLRAEQARGEQGGGEGGREGAVTKPRGDGNSGWHDTVGWGLVGLSKIDRLL